MASKMDAYSFRVATTRAMLNILLDEGDGSVGRSI